MTDLSAETRALLDQGRGGDEPSDDAIARNRRQLALKLTGAALGGAAVTTSTGSVLAASGTLKVLALSVALMAGGGALAHHSWRSTPEPSPPAVAPRRSLPPAAPAHLDNERPPPPPLETEGANATATPAPRSGSPSGGATMARSAAPTSIQSELELIRGAQKHLHGGDARAALALLAEHARRFPGGVLSQERDASRVLALCQVGEVASARAQAERFLQRSPQSAFAERVRRSCAQAGR